MPLAERNAIVGQWLERVGLQSFARHYPKQLSGGQEQRVAIARALVTDPKLIVADEPTGNLDSQNGGMVMELLQQLNAEGATICMVTHDPRYAGTAGRIIHLLDGRIVEETAAAR